MKNRALIDTDILSYYFKGDKNVVRNFENYLDDIDLLIAGVAIENDMVLVTNNEKHFQRIPDLNIENWT